MARSYEDQISLFETTAVDSFEFLVHEFSFNGPIASGYKVDWSSPELRVQLFFDDRDGRVSTSIRAGGRPSSRADLVCLFVQARLGSAQEIREIARTSRQMAPVVESHARALRRLLPLLTAPGGSSLIESCNGS